LLSFANPENLKVKLNLYQIITNETISKIWQTENSIIWHKHMHDMVGESRFQALHHSHNQTIKFTIILASQAPTHIPMEGIHHYHSTQAPIIIHILIYILIFTINQHPSRDKRQFFTSFTIVVGAMAASVELQPLLGHYLCMTDSATRIISLSPQYIASSSSSPSSSDSNDIFSIDSSL